MKQLKPVIDDVRIRATQVNIVHLEEQRALDFISEMEEVYAKPFESGEQMATLVAVTAKSGITFSYVIVYMELVGWLVSNLGKINLFLSNHPDALTMLLNGMGRGIGDMEIERQKALSELDDIMRSSRKKIRMQ